MKDPLLCPPIRYLNIRSKKEAIKEMTCIGTDPTGIKLMVPKLFHYNLRVDGLTAPQANILKQEMLSAGGEAVLARDVVTGKPIRTNAVLSGTERQIRQVIKKLKIQPFGLSDLSLRLAFALSSLNNGEISWKGRKRSWRLGKKTLIMGILNVTPDSFFDGGRFLDKEKAVARALEMEEDGADIIDIGGESTRPGAEPISLKEELKRVIPIINALSKKLKVPISIDTTKAQVAKAALEEGAEIINDISAFGFDPEMAAVAAHYQPLVILMHIRGTPKTMQMDTGYSDIFLEIYNYLAEKITYAVAQGVPWEGIAIDPGMGFGKSPDDNLRIIKNLRQLRTIGRPILIGTSRKSFIGHTLGLSVDERLEGTYATVCAGAWEGANIIRVHDVREMKRVITMVDAIKNS